jgi:prolyl-tRNA synthetase
VHETAEEAQKETMMILELYKEFAESELAIPVISGIKTEREKFAGAEATYCVEALMADGKALQMGTSHFLGQHFSKVFNIRFEDRNQKLQYGWQTSWGVSTRLIGAVVMAHGDDSGLKLPPRIAPIQVVIVPISGGDWQKTVLPVATRIKDELKQAGIRVKLDHREEFTPGWKFANWEMRGVPLRIEVGPRDIKNNQAIAVRRDTGDKTPVALDELKEKVRATLADIQKSLLKAAFKYQQDNSYEVDNFEEFKSVLENQRGLIKTFWCGASACEDRIKNETMGTIRAVLLDKDKSGKANGKCILCGKETDKLVYFARAY